MQHVSTLSYFRIGGGGGCPKKVAGVQPSKNADIEQKIAEIFHENDGNYGYRRMTLILQRDFQASAPNEKWVTDVSEFKCAEGKLYLSPIKDLFNDEIIAYDLARSPNSEQITRMMAQAVARLDGAMESFFGRSKRNVILAKGLTLLLNWSRRFAITFITTTMSVFK